jgi:hypothetical protein
MLGQPAACILLLTTGATAFDYLASLTVQDAATAAKPAAKDPATYLESLPTPKPATIKEAVAAAPVLVPRTDPFSNPKAEARQEASTTWDAARRKAQDDGPKADYAARAREWVLNDGFHAPAKASLMADDFVWFGPIVGPLSKQDFLRTVELFKVYEGFPDLKMHLAEFTRDPVEENRYWSILRLEGTHTEPQASGTGFSYKPTNTKLDVGPQCVSVTFDAEGRVSRYTGGYVVDRTQGKTGMLGAMFAVTKTVGGFVPSLRVAKILNAIGARLKNFPKARSHRDDLPARWRPLGRRFGKRTAEAWD